MGKAWQGKAHIESALGTKRVGESPNAIYANEPRGAVANAKCRMLIEIYRGFRTGFRMEEGGPRKSKPK